MPYDMVALVHPDEYPMNEGQITSSRGDLRFDFFGDGWWDGRGDWLLGRMTGEVLQLKRTL